MNINRATGRVTWSPTASQLGNHLVLISATDALGASAFQQFQIGVRSVNVAPLFTSTPISTAAVGTAYRYNASAVDSDDEVTYSLVAAPSGMLIDTRSGAITYQPVAAQIGDQSVTVRATDARGLSASQSFTLVVSDDRTAPNLSIDLSRTVVVPGESVRIQVIALDDSGIATVTLTIDGQPQQLDSSRGLTYIPAQQGWYVS